MKRALELAKELIKVLEEKIDAEHNVEQYELSTLNPGEVFKIGEYDFMVLEQMEGQTAVISKGFMAEDKQFDDDTRDYNKSAIKKFIESEIQPVIEAAVGADNIVEHEVDLTSVDMQKEFENCRCKVRLITFDEARKYNNLIADKTLSDWWWTLTPWSTEERGFKYSLAVVCPSGNFNYYDYFSYCGVRPFCILKSNIFVSKGGQE